jgi:hypothetical protein
MYCVDGNFDTLKSLINARNTRDARDTKDTRDTKCNTFIGVLGHNHKTLSFNSKPNGQCVLNYVNDRGSFQITLRFLKISFDIVLDRKHPHWYWINNELSLGDKWDGSLSRKDIPLIAMTIGDLFKYYHYQSIVKKTPETQETPETSTTSTTHDKDLNDTVKRSLKIDTSDPNSKDILSYVSDCNITLWNNIGKNNNIANIKDFCNLLVVFEPSIFTKIKHNKREHYRDFDLILARQYLDNLIALQPQRHCLMTHSTLSKLVRFYLYRDMTDELHFDTLYFDSPRPLIEVLKMLQQEKKEDKRYDELIRMITKPIRNKFTQILETKFKQIIVNNIRQLTCPSWALRNVYIMEWKYNDENLLDSSEHWERHGVRNDKFKYISSKRTPRPMEHPFNKSKRYIWLDRCDGNVRVSMKTKSKNFKQVVVDGKYIVKYEDAMREIERKKAFIG